MPDFRRDLRAAFSAQQDDLNPLGDAPDRLLERGLARRRSSLLPRLAAAAAAIVVAAAVVGVLLVMRLNQPLPAPARSVATPASPTPSPAAASSPTPVRKPFAASDSVPALAFRDSADRSQWDAVLWDGSGLGRLAAAPAAIMVNPAATLFLGTGSVTDRHGQTAATIEPIGKGLATWADDGRSLCRITPGDGPLSGIPASLEIAPVGGAWRRVGQFGTIAQSSGVGVAACSTLNDRAVLIEHGYQGGGAHQVWIVQLSTGRVLWARSFPSDPATTIDIVASHDGSYVAEGRWTCCPGSPHSTTVYGPTGLAVGTFEGHAGGFAGLAFSWDGSLLVLAAGADESQVSVVEVRTGATVWRAPEGLKVAGVTAEPLAGGRLAIALNSTGAFAGPDGYEAAADLYLLDAAGQVRKLDFKIRPV